MYPSAPGVRLVVRFAQKQHRCDYNTKHMIEPGDEYVEETIAPWTPIADDVDDDGRTITHPSGHWMHMRYHMQCRDKVEWGYE